jgi:hypothetical protein
MKGGLKMGKKTSQKFQQIPYKKLKTNLNLNVNNMGLNTKRLRSLLLHRLVVHAWSLARLIENTEGFIVVIIVD